MRPRRRSTTRESSLVTAKVEQLEVRAVLAAGDLDSTFGNGGRVVTSFNDLGTVFNQERGRAVAVQADGKILAGGTVNSSSENTSGSNIAGLARYNADGSLDLRFGAAGFFTTQLLSDIRAVLALPNGKILIAGPTFVTPAGNANGGTPSMAVVQLLSDGSIDTTGFGNRGFAFVQFQDTNTNNNVSSTPYAMTLQTVAGTQYIILAGEAFNSTGSTDFGVARLTINGNLDTTFNTKGY